MCKLARYTFQASLFSQANKGGGGEPPVDSDSYSSRIARSNKRGPLSIADSDEDCQIAAQRARESLVSSASIALASIVCAQSRIIFKSCIFMHFLRVAGCGNVDG